MAYFSGLYHHKIWPKIWYVYVPPSIGSWRSPIDLTSIGGNFGSDFRLVSSGAWSILVLGAHLPTWQNRFVQDLLFRGRGSPGPELDCLVSSVAVENPMENPETQWMFFFWENHGKIEENPLSMEVWMGKPWEIYENPQSMEFWMGKPWENLGKSTINGGFEWEYQL